MKYFIILLLLNCSGLFAQLPNKESGFVKWMTLDEALKKVINEPKPVFIDFYTDWCGWCKKMMATTYADAELAHYINSYFYPVKFNAEGKDSVNYLGQKYVPLSNQPRSTHPLAAKLLNNNLVYPSTLFLNGFDKNRNEFKLNLISSGYLEKTKFEPLLIFSLENVWRNSTYDMFNDQFLKTFYDSTTEQKQKIINWYSPKEYFNGDLTKKKKTLVMINSLWCSSCIVMKKTSFIDSTVNKYLTEKYNLVDFNPIIEDSLIYKGQKHFNEKNPQFPFHQLAFKLGRNSVIFPSLVVLDESMEILDVVPSFIDPTFLNDIIHYYGEDFYKSKSWQDYVKVKNNDR